MKIFSDEFKEHMAKEEPNFLWETTCSILMYVLIGLVGFIMGALTILTLVTDTLQKMHISC